MKQALTSALIVWVAMVMGTPLATASDNAASEPLEPPPVSEASRLDEVRALVNAMPPATLVFAVAPDQKFSGRAFCRRLLMDLNEDGVLLPLEPFAVLSQAYPLVRPSVVDAPEEADRASDRTSARKLGASFARRVDRCVADSPNDAFRFDGFDKFVGAPPYRVYALPPKLRSPDRAELIYRSEPEQSLGLGRDGYAVVDLGSCIHTGGVSPLPAYRNGASDLSTHGSALVIRGRALVVWDVVPGAAVEATVLARRLRSQWRPQAICHWDLRDR